METFGFTEQEARIFVHLDEAERLLEELTREEGSEGTPSALLGNVIWRETHTRELFAGLYRRLGIRVLRRRYPEGWGAPRPKEDDQG